MPDVIIQRLTEYNLDDATQLGRLMPFLSSDFPDAPIEESLLRAIIESPYHEQLVARLDGRIVGSATLSLTMGAAAGRKAYLEDFVTDPGVQRQGIGSKMWDEMLKWCREHGVGLDFTSNPTRQVAHAFYKSHGATIRDTTVFHVDVE